MITGFRHRGLKRLFEDDDSRKLPSQMVERIRDILTALDVAERLEDMDLPSFRLHALKGDLNGYWAVTVRANWRIIFQFEDGTAHGVDLVDYH